MSEASSHLQAILQPLIDHQKQRGEIVEPGDSYWYHRPLRNFPPKEKSLYLPAGKGLPWLCGHCDRAKLDKHIAAFEAVATSVQGQA